MSHTPGPWIVKDHLYGDKNLRDIRASDHSLIAKVGNLGATSDFKPAAKRWQSEIPANANLIASAPALLEALQALLIVVDQVALKSGWPDNGPRAKARAAITKAQPSTPKERG